MTPNVPVLITALKEILAKAESNVLLDRGICYLVHQWGDHYQLRDTNIKPIFAALDYNEIYPVEISMLGLSFDNLEASMYFQNNHCWQIDSPQYHARVKLLKEMIIYLEAIS